MTKISNEVKGCIGNAKKMLPKIITKEQAKDLIVNLIPCMKNRQIVINHIGEYDKNGSRHIDALCVIQFNGNQQITIWDKGIQYFDGGRMINEQAVFCGPNVFTCYRLLHNWGIVS